jgi:hypothetical protein
MAKRHGVPGWHAMRKDELIRALIKQAKTSESRKAASHNGKSGAKTGLPKTNGHTKSNGHVHGQSNGKTNGHCGGNSGDRVKSSRARRRLEERKFRLSQSKDLAFHCSSDAGGPVKDRLVVMVRDSYWLHAYWELSRQSVERARVAMGQHWHAARAVLRVWEVARNGTTSSARKLVRDVEVHGGVNNWYIDVHDPPKSFQLDIGYLAPEGKFFSLARSNSVSTPPPETANAVDGNWEEVAEDFDRIYAMSGGYDGDTESSELKNLFEERLRRPMGSPMVTRYGLGAGNERPDFSFQVDAELVVYGMADPDAHVTLRGEPVRLQPDGSFSMRFALPDRRQVLPVVASSADGVEQRTIVLAVERNTKVMEPVIREPDA